jgi:hypothetical protein
MISIRSRFVPDRIEVVEGDELTIHVTNVEQTTDMIHGLGIVEHDVNIVVDPGRDQDRRSRCQARRVSVLLHELLLRTPPGDAGLPRREAAQRSREQLTASQIEHGAGGVPTRRRPHSDKCRWRA